MKKKIIIIIITVLLILGIIIYLLLNSETTETITEYQPEEEITDEQLRKTIISLYYINKKTNEVIGRGKLIDIKMLLNEPYKEIFEMLKENPKNEELESAIPTGTKINKIELKNNILYLDLSEEFINNHKGGEKAEKATIKSIVNTMSQLTEVEGVKILIDGKENREFKDGKIKFEKMFINEK